MRTDASMIRLAAISGRPSPPRASAKVGLKAAALLVLLAMFLSVQTRSGDAEAKERDYQLFACAMQNHSTAPNYVLITVIDVDAKQETQITTGANLLSGAIHREYGIPFSEDGRSKADQVALSAHDRRFTFHKASALRNIKPRYTPEVLAEVRDRMASLTEADIRVGLPGVSNDYDHTLHAIYMSRRSWESWAAYRDALAHVLLERGILCGIADVSGQLYVDSKACPREPR